MFVALNLSHKGFPILNHKFLREIAVFRNGKTSKYVDRSEINLKAYSAARSPHGKKKNDENGWMQRAENKEKLQRFIAQENATTEKSLGLYWLKNRKSKEFLKMKSTLEQYLSVERVFNKKEKILNNYYYWHKQVGGSRSKLNQYFRRDMNTGKEVLLFDEKSISETHNAIVLGYEVSPSDKHVLVTTRDSAIGGESETTDLLVFEIQAEKKSKVVAKVQGVYRSIPGNKNQVYYTTMDDKMRVDKVFMFEIPKTRTESSEHALVYTELESNFFVDISKTKDGAYIIINCNSLDSSELFALSTEFIPNLKVSENDKASKQNQIPLLKVRPREKNIEIYMDHIKDNFIFLTNAQLEGHKNNTRLKILKAPGDNPHYLNWEPWVDFGEDHEISDVDLFRDYALVYTKCLDDYRIYSVNTTTMEKKLLDLNFSQNNRFYVEPLSNLDFNSSTAEFAYSSPVQMRSNATWDLQSGKVVQDQKLVPFHWNMDDYESYKEEATARDGTKIPITVSRRKNVNEKKRKTLIHVYGCYGMPLEPLFRLEDIYFLKKGWNVVLAHVRGGGELGKRWYDLGRKENKKNSITDLIDCTRYLQSTGYCDPLGTAVTAASAGGLVVSSAMLNSAVSDENLFKAAVLQVPFLDPLSSLCDPNLPLSSLEVDEWGDPINNMNDYRQIQGYSPYDLLERISDRSTCDINEVKSIMKRLPSTLILSGYKDKRVPVWQSTKWVMRYKNIIETVNKADQPDKSILGRKLRFVKNVSSEYSKVFLHVDMDKNHFDINQVSAENYEFDPYSHKAIRNLFLDKFV